MNRKKRVFCWIAVWCMLLTAFPMQGAAADGAEPETEEESLTQVPMSILWRMAESNCEQNPAKYDNDGAASWAFNENSSNWWHTRYNDDGVDDSRELTKSEWTAIKSDYAENGFREDAEYAYIGSGFGRTINLKRIECKMRNEGYAICDYRLLTSLDGKSYTPVVLNQDGAANGTIATLQYENNAGIIELPQPVAAKYFRIEVLSVGSSNDAAVSDIKVFGYPYSEELKPRLKIDLSDYSMTYGENEKKELADLAENPADLNILGAEFEEDPEKGYVVSGKLRTNAEKLKISGNTPILIKFDFCSEKPGGQQGMIGRMDRQYGIQISSSGAEMYNDSGEWSWKSSTCGISNDSWGMNQWHTVIGVFNGAKMQIFVDGIAGNSDSTSIVSHSNPFCIGYNYDNDGKDFKGKMANIAVYTENQVPIFEAKNEGEDCSTFLAEQLEGKTPTFQLGVRPHYTIKDTSWADDDTNVTVTTSLVPDAGYYFNADSLPEFTFGNESAAFTAKSVDENGVLHVSYTLTSAQAETYRAYKAQELAKELAGTLAAIKAELQQIKPSPKFPAAERDALIQRIDTFETTTAGMTIGAKQKAFDQLKADCDNFRKGKRVPVLRVSFEDNVEDSSGFDNNGTPVGEPEYVEGVVGKALHIVNEGNEPSDVAAQYVNFGKGKELQFGTGNFTIGLWYKSSVREASGGWHSAVISNKDWSTGDNFGFNMGHMNQSGDRGWGINWNFNTKKDDAAEGGRVETGRYAQPTDGAWHYLTGVVDRSSQEIRFYIDGEFKERQSTAGKFGTADTGYDLVLGADGYEHRYGTKDGCFDELVIYQEALPEEMIYELASDGRRSYEIGRMEQIIAKAEPGARFPAASIAAIQKKVADTKAQLEASDNETEKETLFEALTADYEAFLTGDPLVSFHLISDIHTNGKDSENGRNFKTGLINMKEMNPQADVLISCGDNTEYGQEWEVKDFFDLIKENNPVAEKNGKIMVTMGNHDVRGENSGNNWVTSPTTANHGWWSNAYSYYMQNNKDFMPDMPEELTGEEKTYFDYWINGYHFIVLNEENSPKDQASVTEDQLIWLEEKLGESENADNPFDAEKPVFVFIHQALEDTHQHSGLYLGFGPADARMKEILSRYPQTVLCTGHIHNGFGTAEVIERSYGTMADVPSFKETEAWNDSREKGSGYEVYVYEDEIVFRAADFLKGEWLPEYDYSVKRTTLPVLVKKADNLREKDYTIQSWKAVSADLKAELAKAKVLMNKRYPLNVRVSETKSDTFLYHQDTRAEIKAVQKNLSRLLDQLELSTDPTTEMQKEIDRLEKEKTDAESAKDKAEQDLKDAQEDLEAANAAKDSVESAKTEADAAKEKAEADMVEAQKAEKEAKEALQKAKEAEAAAKAALETAKKNLEAAQKNAGGKKISRPVLVSVKPGKAGTLKITWNKLQDVSGLEIQYDVNGKFKNAAVKKINASKTSCTLKKLRKGKKYYVRIRGYRNDGDNTVYSAYSAKKSAKVKK